MNRKKIIIIGSTIGIILILVAIFLYINSNKKYVVTFDTNGGSSISSQTIKKGGYVIKPKNPEKSGYVFVEWSYNGQSYNFSSKVNKNIKLVALWKENNNDLIKTYTVVFDSDGGSNVESQNVIENSNCIEPAHPIKDGYTFDGWYLGDIKYNFEDKITQNITLKAKWVSVIDNHESSKDNDSSYGSNYIKIIFDGNGGKTLPDVCVKKGEKVANPGATTREGYKFVSWTLDGAEYNFNTPVTKQITLKASWKKTYRVVCSTENYFNQQDVVEGEKAIRPADPVIPGVTFFEWVDCQTTEPYNFDKPVTQDITLCVHYTTNN